MGFMGTFSYFFSNCWACCT